MSTVEHVTIRRRFHRPTLTVCLGIDLILIAISIAYGMMIVLALTDTWPDLMNVGRDWSLGEIFNYLKWLLLIVVMLRAYLHHRVLLLLMISLFFVLVLADDMLLLHERGSPMLIVPSGLHRTMGPVAFQIGELAIWALLGAVGIALLYTGWRVARPVFRDSVRPMAWLFAGIIFCAVGLDMLHAILPEKTLLGGVFLILEDGGEMLFISALLSYAIGTFGSPAQD